jgi:hypothetical protein
MSSIRFLIFFLHHKLRRLLGLSKKLQQIDLRFCEEQGIDAASIHKTQVFSFFGQFDYRPVAQQVDALVIPKRKRFGNALLQLVDAYNIARQLGVSKIYHRGYSFLQDQALIEGIEFVKGVPNTKENYVIGDFYQNKALLSLCKTPLDRWQVMRAMAGFITLDAAKQDVSETNNQALYIHLRSGDIFKKTPPHCDYGQPPLAFYTKIIRSQAWSKVYLVYEDEYNPVIPALKSFLTHSQIEFETSSGDIHQDVEVLLRAKNLIIARGTFIYPILCISRNIENVFYFEVDEHSLWGLQKSPIHFHKCTDIDGEYRTTILTEWKNDVEQNARMIEYPEARILIG